MNGNRVQVKALAVLAGLLMAGLPASEALAGPPISSGPYVRAELGYSAARSANFRDDRAVSADCFIAVSYPGVCGASLDALGSSGLATVAIGYRLAPGIRGEISYGYRNGYSLHGYDPEGTYFDPPVKSKTLLFSAFFDLPVTFDRVHPYVGIGIGRSRNTMDHLKWDDGTDSGVLPGGSNSDRAWQLTLGADVRLNERLVVEGGYRYMDMGKFKKSAGADLVGQFNPAPNGTGSATGRLRADEVFFAVRYAF